MKRTVFISHSSKDKPIGEKVCRFLEGHGVQCWIAPRDVTPGKNYGAAILDAIDECSVFLLILSGESNKSGQVVREVERAASTDTIIIPFRVEDVQPSRNLEFYVSSAHWLDAVSKPLDKHLHELLTAIKDWQQSGIVPPERTVPTVPAVPTVGEATPPPLPPKLSSSPWLFWSSSQGWPVVALVAGAVLAALLIFAIVIYKVGRRVIDPGTAAAQKSEQPSATPQKQQTPPSATALSPPPSSVRRRPGEPITSLARPRAASPAPSPPAKTTTAASATTPLIREVVASSELKADGKSYRPGFAFDGNKSTAWVPKGDGTGQSLSVQFKVPATLTSVSILGGAGTDETRHQANNRAGKIRMTLSDGTTQVFTLEDKLKLQRFELKPQADVKWVKFDIVSVVRGTKYNNTPIAEIAFNRAESD